MCDGPDQPLDRWKGWLDLPAPPASRALGPWVEISHVITEELSRAPVLPQPRIRRIQSKPEHPANVTELHMVAHHGTHVDAPSYFIADGPIFNQIPLERLYGPAVVWRIEKGPYGAIEPADLERAAPRLRPGDMVLLDTGWAQHVNTDVYRQQSHLTGEAAEWLVAHGAKLVGIDCTTPDMTSDRRPPDFTFPVHHTLLSHGVLIAEHVTNIRPFAGRRVEALFLALNVAGSDGGPARAVARPLDD